MITHVYDELIRDFNDLESNLTQLSDDQLFAFLNRSNDAKIFYSGLEQSAKKSSNSLYGYFGSGLGIFSEITLAADITREGVGALTMTHNIINDYFNNVLSTDIELFNHLQEKFPILNIIKDEKTIRERIGKITDIAQYSDTDSTYIDCFTIMNAIGIPFVVNMDVNLTLDIVETIDDFRFDNLFKVELEKYALRRNMLPNILDFELELISIMGIFVAKKKYMMAVVKKDGVNVSKDGYLKTMGIELARSAMSAYGKKVVKKLCNIIIKSGDIDQIKFLQIIQGIKDEMSVLDHKELCSIMSEKVSLNVYDNYVVKEGRGVYKLLKGAQSQTKAAANYNKFIDDNNLNDIFPYLTQGMDCQYYYTENGDTFAYIAEYGVPNNAPKLSLDKQFEKLVLRPIGRLSKDIIEDFDLTNANNKKVTIVTKDQRFVKKKYD